MPASPAPRDAKDDDGSRWIATLSTPEVDNHGDTVTLDAWQWEGATVPLLVSHAGPPVGSVRPYRDGNRLLGEITFLPTGASTAADEARGRVEAGDLRSLSPRFVGVGTRNGRGGIDFRNTISQGVLARGRRRESGSPDHRGEVAGSRLVAERKAHETNPRAPKE